ncbi:MAG: hypothetical protein P8X92_01610, partial [Dehalococcoidia bacterium]
MKREILNRRVNNPVEEAKAMRIGDIVEIANCNPMPGVVGQRAEIVDLQIQEHERYRTYPVWVKILTGERQGKVYGFHYTEVEVVEEKTGLGITTELEAILAEVGEVSASSLMKIGDTVKVNKCDWKPRLVGQRAEIVDLQMQEYERYRIYPVSARMLSGEFRGKLYGFNYDELEVITEETKPIAALEKILEGITRAEDISEIERTAKSLLKDE